MLQCDVSFTSRLQSKAKHAHFSQFLLLLQLDLSSLSNNQRCFSSTSSAQLLRATSFGQSLHNVHCATTDLVIGHIETTKTLKGKLFLDP